MRTRSNFFLPKRLRRDYFVLMHPLLTFDQAVPLQQLSEDVSARARKRYPMFKPNNGKSTCLHFPFRIRQRMFKPTNESENRPKRSARLAGGNRTAFRTRPSCVQIIARSRVSGAPVRRLPDERPFCFVASISFSTGTLLWVY